MVTPNAAISDLFSSLKKTRLLSGTHGAAGPWWNCYLDS